MLLWKPEQLSEILLDSLNKSMLPSLLDETPVDIKAKILTVLLHQLRQGVCSKESLGLIYETIAQSTRSV